MRKLFLLMMVTALFVTTIQAQGPLKTRNGYVQFNANKNSSKDYEGKSNEATAVFNVANGDVALLLPVRTIHFPNALLEEHVNENYLESTKYPNITFKGKLSKYNPSILEKEGIYTLSVDGSITMHGVTIPFKSDKVSIEVKGKSIVFKVDVPVNYKDYKIDIPSTVVDKIASPILVKTIIKFSL